MMNISSFLGEEMLQTCSVWCFSIYNYAYSTQLSPALNPIELLLAMDPIYGFCKFEFSTVLLTQTGLDDCSSIFWS
jgi:hypothetical protein